MTIAAGTALVSIASKVRGLRPASVFGDRLVLITGGARGLGLALAQEFGEAGARLVLVSRTRSELTHAQAILRDRQIHAAAFECDVRDEARVRSLVERVTKSFGAVDVLVNNAGVISMMPFAHATNDDFEDSLRTHFWGPLFMTRACLAARESPRGFRILNIASLGGRVAVPHLLPYAVGKFAMVALSEGITAELAHEGVIVTTATPGLMRTGSHRNVLVRGRHRAEATWFALASATPLTSMAAHRAARTIVRAHARGRARVSPGWQAGAAQRANMLAPEIASRLASMGSFWLPSADRGSGQRRVWSRDLDLGWVTSLLPTSAAIELNQPFARGERR
jgi:NAD(P)-dependent dehydrogenase (short-subunit alcohol dehydrogenase family)